MAFTYDITTDRGRIRRLVGDTILDTGALPDGVNFSDAEIDEFFSMEGNHIQRAAALALESLASAWAAEAGRYRSGPEDEQSLQAVAFGDRAAMLRNVYGWNTADDSTAAPPYPANMTDWQLSTSFNGWEIITNTSDLIQDEDVLTVANGEIYVVKRHKPWPSRSGKDGFVHMLLMERGA